VHTQVFGLERVACERRVHDTPQSASQPIIQRLELLHGQLSWRRRGMSWTSEDRSKAIPSVFASETLEPFVVAEPLQIVFVDAVLYVDHAFGFEDLPGFPGGPGRSFDALEVEDGGPDRLFPMRFRIWRRMRRPWHVIGKDGGGEVGRVAGPAGRQCLSHGIQIDGFRYSLSA
jgi:hypothetical protein